MADETIYLDNHRGMNRLHTRVRNIWPRPPTTKPESLKGRQLLETTLHHNTFSFDEDATIGLKVANRDFRAPIGSTYLARRGLGLITEPVMSPAAEYNVLLDLQEAGVPVAQAIGVVQTTDPGVGRFIGRYIGTSDGLLHEYVKGPCIHDADPALQENMMRIVNGHIRMAWDAGYKARLTGRNTVKWDPTARAVRITDVSRFQPAPIDVDFDTGLLFTPEQFQELDWHKEELYSGPLTNAHGKPDLRVIE